MPSSLRCYLSVGEREREREREGGREGGKEREGDSGREGYSGEGGVMTLQHVLSLYPPSPAFERTSGKCGLGSRLALIGEIACW